MWARAMCGSQVVGAALHAHIQVLNNQKHMVVGVAPADPEAGYRKTFEGPTTSRHDAL